MAFFFASPIDVEIRLEGEEERKQVEIKGEKEKMTSCPVYFDGESIVGQASLRLRVSIAFWLAEAFSMSCGMFSYSDF